MSVIARGRRMAEGDAVICLRTLLRKYMYHVVDHEGTDFLEIWNSNKDLFSDEEWGQLVEIRDDILKLKEPDVRDGE